MSNLFGQDGRLKSQIPLKVYSSNRRTRKLLGADSYNQLIIKCREKFNLHDYEEDNIKVVLYDDGMEVDSDSFLFLDPNTSIMILQGNEIWSPQLPPLND
ncbi:lipid transferase CIDEB-like [Mytilus galloprovincialis]|uniref:lipid transferase CIDEB-like n=1 Tax=Mytilus galloprovincialis TaxID=29158 RepID=UPI003F7C97B5